MTNIITKKVLLLAVTLLLAPATQAQEFIKEVKNHNDNYSVIRQYRENLWIISDFNLGKSVFSMVSETGITTQQLVLGYIEGTDSTIIRDFKIYKDTVYFCGQTWYGKTSQAVWGYFPLAGFPSVPVYFNVRKYNSFDKLEVFSVNSTGEEVHVVMIGGEITTGGVVVDEIKTGLGTVTEYTSPLYEQVYTMVDLIQTEHYIVVSANHMSNQLVVGASVINIQKPTTLNTTIFTCPMDHNNSLLYSTVSLHLVHCEGDSMAAIYMNGNDFHVIALTNPLICHGACTFPSPSVTMRLKYIDADYDADRHSINLLANDMMFSSSVIMRVDDALVLGPGNVPYKHYPNDKINSIIYTGIPVYYHAASGYEIESHTLRYYRISDNPVAQCASEGNLLSSNQKFDWPIKELHVGYDSCRLEMLQLPSYTYESPVSTICE